MNKLKEILKKIIAPFLKGGKPDWIAITQLIVCVLIIAFNLPEGFGTDIPDWLNISTSTFNWLGALYLIVTKWLK